MTDSMPLKEHMKMLKAAIGMAQKTAQAAPEPNLPIMKSIR